VSWPGSRTARPWTCWSFGGGVTGVGLALDAASRGLSVALGEKHDLAFGSSRWSSKLVHGGLRYLASGNVAIARECAIERGILMQHTAPHLVRPLTQVVPIFAELPAREYAVIRAAFLAGDALPARARTSARLLPASRRLPARTGVGWTAAVRTAGLRGVILAWDGQVVDDARLVVAIARTAARFGVRVLTRCAAENVTGAGATLRDRLTGDSFTVTARVVINAAGVWAGQSSSVASPPGRAAPAASDWSARQAETSWRAYRHRDGWWRFTAPRRCGSSRQPPRTRRPTDPSPTGSTPRRPSFVSP